MQLHGDAKMPPQDTGTKRHIAHHQSSDPLQAFRAGTDQPQVSRPNETVDLLNAFDETTRQVPPERRVTTAMQGSKRVN